LLERGIMEACLEVKCRCMVLLEEKAVQAQERADRLLAKLQELGIDPADLE
jgi:hypothetical protein